MNLYLDLLIAFSAAFCPRVGKIWMKSAVKCLFDLPYLGQDIRAHSSILIGVYWAKLKLLIILLALECSFVKTFLSAYSM